MLKDVEGYIQLYDQVHHYLPRLTTLQLPIEARETTMLRWIAAGSALGLGFLATGIALAAADHWFAGPALIYASTALLGVAYGLTHPWRYSFTSDGVEVQGFFRRRRYRASDLVRLELFRRNVTASRMGCELELEFRQGRVLKVNGAIEDLAAERLFHALRSELGPGRAAA